MSQNQLTGLESFQIIQQMIQAAKDEHRESGQGWLVWGWLLFITSVASAVMMNTALNQYIGYLWTSMLFVGFIIYAIIHFTSRNKQKVKTYIQVLLDRIGAGFYISLITMVAASFLSKSDFSFGYYYILYAFWMYIYGSALKFKPLMIGACVNWVAAIAIFLIEDFYYDMVVSAMAILIGYLVPGHILRYEYRRKMNVQVES